MPRPIDDTDDEFNCLYFAWLQCGQMTHTLIEEREREFRQRIKDDPTRCRHGKTPLTCEKCYLNGQHGL